MSPLTKLKEWKWQEISNFRLWPKTKI